VSSTTNTQSVRATQGPRSTLGPRQRSAHLNRIATEALPFVDEHLAKWRGYCQT
jgi:hypothetical protein